VHVQSPLLVAIAGLRIRHVPCVDGCGGVVHGCDVFRCHRESIIICVAFFWPEGFEGGEEAFRLAPSVCWWDSVVGPKVGLVNRSDVADSAGDCAEGVTVQGQIQCEAAKGVVLPFLYYSSFVA
jgi:hypothetical protein